MKKLCIVFLFLSGCASTYSPKLATPPSDIDKYQSDVSECHMQVKQRAKAANDDYYSSGRWAFGIFGLAGNAINGVTSDSQKDYTKSGWTMMDECMMEKGYKLAN